jgi:hypothetical protein
MFKASRRFWGESRFGILVGFDGVSFVVLFRRVCSPIGW